MSEWEQLRQQGRKAETETETELKRDDETERAIASASASVFITLCYIVITLFFDFGKVIVAKEEVPTRLFNTVTVFPLTTLAVKVN